jgi:DNA invertase Pin-like site-specific DNA recombinase
MTLSRAAALPELKINSPQGAHSEEEWKLIRDRMNDGRQEKAEAQGYVGGPASYGLRIVGKGAPGSYLGPEEREIEVLELAAPLSTRRAIPTGTSGLGLVGRCAIC